VAKVERALISVTDKTGIVEFAKKLEELGVEILSTGGTARALKEGGVTVKEVSEYTGFPEMLDGRVKTLHPKIHGGILYVRENKEHLRQVKKNGITPIDLLVVNLYAFEKTVAREGCTLDEAIENIDIGGPTLLRSSAKNFKYVTVVVDPTDYGRVVKELEEEGGSTSLATRFSLAQKVFRLTNRYDAAISRYLEGKTVEETGA